MKFEEEKVFRKCRELDKGEKQASTPQVNTSQSTAMQVSGVTGSQVTSSSGSGTGLGEEPQGGGTTSSSSQITSSRVTGSQTIGATSSKTQSQAVSWDEDAPFLLHKLLQERRSPSGFKKS